MCSNWRRDVLRRIHTPHPSGSLEQVVHGGSLQQRSKANSLRSRRGSAEIVTLFQASSTLSWAYWRSELLQNFSHGPPSTSRSGRLVKPAGVLVRHLRPDIKKPPQWGGFFMYGGEGGIRTPDTGLGYTPLAGERLRPLGHLSGVCTCLWQMRNTLFNTFGQEYRRLLLTAPRFVGRHNNNTY